MKCTKKRWGCTDVTNLEPTLHIALPRPFSLNQAFMNVPGRGRVKTSEYKSWCASADDLLSQQKIASQFKAPVQIVLHVGERGVGSMDIDNTFKPAIDALVRAKVIHDDSRKWVRSVQGSWTPELSGMVAIVSPAPELKIFLPALLRKIAKTGRDYLAAPSHPIRRY